MKSWIGISLASIPLLPYPQIDLEGYEIKEDSLEYYVQHQLSKYSGEAQSRAKAVLDRMKM
jgi:hypothetical protein